MVSIKESECYAIFGNKQNDMQPAALRLFDVPNNIVLEDLRGFIDAKVVDFAKGVNVASLLKPFDNEWKWHYLRVRISNVQGSLFKQANGSDVPDALQKYVVTEVSK